MRKTSGPVGVTPESVVDALGLGPKATFDELLAVVERAHGKPIELMEVPNSVIPTVTGLWVEKDQKSIILLPEEDNQLHRTHAVCHEFGHMLLGHDGCGVAVAPMPSIFQHVGMRGGIKRMLARSLHWNEAELAAERVAYLLSRLLLHDEPATTSEFERTFV